ncbi:hypothetical protein M2454_002748 [Aequitasia blattaphilus]|nr:hypothetical protein [Aequitasia blattaphilus]
MKERKSKSVSIVGIVSIMSMVCVAVVWIGLMVAPPWESKACEK